MAIVTIVRQRRALKDYYRGVPIDVIMARYQISRGYIYRYCSRKHLPLRDKELNIVNFRAGNFARHYSNGK